MSLLTSKQQNVILYNASDLGLTSDEVLQLHGVRFSDALNIYEIHELISAIFDVLKTTGAVTDPTIDAEHERETIRHMIALANSKCAKCNAPGRFTGSFCGDCYQAISNDTSHRGYEVLKNSTE